jgi:pyruvate/2-oxoglutarate dehydrogenase complex dihydrolipoamide acyltransferase (E2) component
LTARLVVLVSSVDRPTIRTVLVPEPTTCAQVTELALVAEVDAAASKAMAAEARDAAPATSNDAAASQRARDHGRQVLGVLIQV